MTSRIGYTIILALNLALAYVAGVISILGFFTLGTFADLSGMLAQWVAVLVGFALLLGLGNLLKVHIGRVVRGQKDWFYSLVLVGSAITVLAFGLATGPGDPSIAWVFRWVYHPLAAAVFSLLAFFLTTAIFRMPKMRSGEAVVLLAVALVVVLGQAPFVLSQLAPGAAPPLEVLVGAKDWLLGYPALAGIRAILLGVAFGAIGVSLRVLLGFDRPYLE